MKLVRGIENLPPEAAASVAAVGFFDGFHLGHHALVQKAASTASSAGAPVLVYTFDRHPLEIVDPSRAPFLLTTLEEKIALASLLPVDFFLVGEFDKALSQMEHGDFLRKIVVERLRPIHVVAGFNYRYGKGHLGNVQTLSAEAPPLGVPVTVVDAVRADGDVVSSSRIRSLLSGSGKVEEAARLLGRPYALTGKVVKGDGRGKSLGIPTANLEIPPGKLIPRIGIYAGNVFVENERYGGLISIGKRPTFGGKEVVVEVYLLDFHGDLYGKNLRVELVSWIRDEEKFASVESLVEKMKEDIAIGKKLLAGALGKSASP